MRRGLKYLLLLRKARKLRLGRARLPDEKGTEIITRSWAVTRDQARRARLPDEKGTEMSIGPSVGSVPMMAARGSPIVKQ